MVVIQVEILFPKVVEDVQAIFQCMCLILCSEIAPFGNLQQLVQWYTIQFISNSSFKMLKLVVKLPNIVIKNIQARHSGSHL